MRYMTVAQVKIPDSNKSFIKYESQQIVEVRVDVDICTLRGRGAKTAKRRE